MQRQQWRAFRQRQALHVGDEALAGDQGLGNTVFFKGNTYTRMQNVLLKPDF